MRSKATDTFLYSLLSFHWERHFREERKREVKREKNEKGTTIFFRKLSFLFGWGRWIRTTGMADSESAALPLGDTPLFICDIIYYSTVMKKVKHYFLLRSNKNSRRETKAIFSAMCPDKGLGHYTYFYCGAIKIAAEKRRLFFRPSAPMRGTAIEIVFIAEQ